MPTDRVTRSSTRILKKQQSCVQHILDDESSTNSDDEIFKKNKCYHARKESLKMGASQRRGNKNKRKTDNEHEITSSTSASGDSLNGTNSELDIVEVTPSKQRKQKQQNVDLFSPSRLIGRLSISSDDDDEDNDKKYEVLQPKTKNNYQNAKISLACIETNHLPGRENEIKQLCDFMLEHLHNSMSGSLYVSGQPGTGKTACLSRILKNEEFINKFTKLYINCTSVSSIGAVYKKICTELNLKPKEKTEKGCLNAIEKFITENSKMTLLVLDEIDQLIGKKQSILYTIFEWPSKRNAKIIIIGIANSLDLTDRLLMRLNVKCNLKPKLLHFAPYTKQQIIDIFTSRLENAGVTNIFPPVTIQLLAAKVAAISGDVRKALDIGRRVIEIAEQQKNSKNINNILELSVDGVNPLFENNEQNIVESLSSSSSSSPPPPIQVKQVVDVLNSVYGASQKLLCDIEDSFPLQHKILICTLLLMLKKCKNKDITIGRMHDVYKRICEKRNIFAVDQTEFVSICSLVETRGIIRLTHKKEPRLSKVFLQWDEEEVITALKDKQLIANILEDVSCVEK